MIFLPDKLVKKSYDFFTWQTSKKIVIIIIDKCRTVVVVKGVFAVQIKVDLDEVTAFYGEGG